MKWEEHEPFEVTDFYTGENKISKRNCFTIGTLIWDEKEQGFKFQSCGLRYLKYRTDGLEEFVLDFCKMIEDELLNYN